jgi:hypothetical protein
MNGPAKLRALPNDAKTVHDYLPRSIIGDALDRHKTIPIPRSSASLLRHASVAEIRTPLNFIIPACIEKGGCQRTNLALNQLTRGILAASVGLL